MSRAYCLTCNEQVMVTASGTCTSGHPVTTHDGGPEPWVGHAASDDDVELERASEPVELDLAELEELHHVGAGVGSVNGNGHAGGVNGHGSVNGHGTTGYLGNGDADQASSTPVTRHPANSQVSDDLSAMLAEALNSDRPATSEPQDAGQAPTVPETTAPETTFRDSEDWGDLATLAAELELDGSSAQAESPVDAPSTPAVTPPVDEDLPSAAWTDDGADDVPVDAPAPEPTSPPSVDPTNFTARGARVGTGSRSARRLFGRRR